jgi:hypothetical protein
MLMMINLALGITAPVASVTVPITSPVMVWPKLTLGRKKTSKKTLQIASVTFLIFLRVHWRNLIANLVFIQLGPSFH